MRNRRCGMGTKARATRMRRVVVGVTGIIRPTAPFMTLQSGTRLGPCEILELAGAGGMGEVYKARDTRLERTVAIKVLPHASGTTDLKQRFEREAQTIASLKHPHICVLHDVGSEAPSTGSGQG